MPTKNLVPTINVWEADKWAHVLIYALFTILTILAIKEQRSSFRKKNVLIQAFLITLIVGIVTECIHGTVLTYRSVEFLDIIANIVGVLTGSLLTFIVLRQIP